MRYRKLGQWGLKVSEISLGAWVTYGDAVKDLERVKEITRIAYEGGVNFFDNADVYAKGLAEELMTKALLEQFPRHELVLSSKVFWPTSDDANGRGLSRKHVRESLERSLKRMGTDYLDLYFCHRYDPEVPMEEIVTTMSNLVDRGLVLYWGTSEWPAARIVEAVQFARANGLHPPAVEQPQYSMLYRERVEKEILPETERFGLGVVVWSPLAMGMLTGRYDEGVPKDSRFERYPQFGERFLTEENVRKVRELKEVAEEVGLTRAQLALAWVLRQKGVTSAITGATRPEQIRESLGAAGVDLPPEVVERIDQILGGGSRA
ncbi:MAG: aldo/keto reductase family protein [Meiothermus sp.]|uniref:aldo/keto reductase family protein n=1 Tax=Meiothermus sp. TaxID=1955249 RepID=UPI0025D08F6F|nr:aldo/keto reductase family protein [Meiothermus sp.]MCS7058370.1 aldo/keto reductase family protein [Meiothermus sp.]MCS7194376.1 aldo/keto reductase family protein [Meiothermus sp.]MDW8089857.1 aldo/keto reductase family protein [Meiothermus sp.]MDW8481717.1 aldo/keto reductase family protein [Meiothermus sp.]